MRKSWNHRTWPSFRMPPKLFPKVRIWHQPPLLEPPKRFPVEVSLGMYRPKGRSRCQSSLSPVRYPAAPQTPQMLILKPVWQRMRQMTWMRNHLHSVPGFCPQVTLIRPFQVSNRWSLAALTRTLLKKVLLSTWPQ